MRRICGVVFFGVLLIICGCSMMDTKNSRESLPREVYAVQETLPMIMDAAMVDGENQIEFAGSAEKKAQYIPKTVWREKERATSDKVCSFTLVKVKEGMDERAVKRFLAGESNTLYMKEGDFFLVKLDFPYWLSELGVDAKGKVWARITDERGAMLYKMFFYWRPTNYCFDVPVLCKYLKFEAREASGAVLYSISAQGKLALASQILYDLGENPIVVDAVDPSNPISIHRKPIRKIHYQLAEKLLEGTESLSDHQKMMVFMDYIADFHIGTTPKESILEEYVGACGRYSNLLATLAYTQGMPARLLSLANYPEEAGHAVCEVFYDGAWHLYDPTFGAYYTTSAPDEAAQPVVLGYEELSQGLGNVPDVTCVVTSPHRLTSPWQYSFLGPRIYEEANPRGVMAPSNLFIYPLAMEASETGSTVLDQRDFSNKYQGIKYIGVASINNIHEWTLSALEPGREYVFSIHGATVDGEATESFQAKASSENAVIIDGNKHIFDNGDSSSLTWKIRFIPESDTATIMLSHDYRGPEWVHIWFSGFTLNEPAH